MSAGGRIGAGARAARTGLPALTGCCAAASGAAGAGSPRGVAGGVGSIGARAMTRGAPVGAAGADSPAGGADGDAGAGLAGSVGLRAARTAFARATGRSAAAVLAARETAVRAGVCATGTASVLATGCSVDWGCAAAGLPGVAVLAARETCSAVRVGVRATRTGSVLATGCSADLGCAAAGLPGAAALAARETCSPVRVGAEGRAGLRATRTDLVPDGWSVWVGSGEPGPTGAGVLVAELRAGVRATRACSPLATGRSVDSGFAEAGSLGERPVVAREAGSPLCSEGCSGARATRTGSAPPAGACGTTSCGAATGGVDADVLRASASVGRPPSGAVGIGSRATRTGFAPVSGRSVAGDAESGATTLVGARDSVSFPWRAADGSPGRAPRGAAAAGAELAVGGVRWADGAFAERLAEARATRAGLVGAGWSGVGAAVVGLEVSAAAVGVRDTA